MGGTVVFGLFLVIIAMTGCTEHGGYEATIKEYEKKYQTYDCGNLKSAYDEIVGKSNNSWKKPVIWKFIKSKCN